RGLHAGDAVAAPDAPQRATTGFADVALVGLLDEMRDGLRVGLRDEAMAALLEAVTELPEVLDDPVVDDRDEAAAVDVGMGVQVVRPSVGRPARVGQAAPPARRAVGEGRPEGGPL